MLDWCLPATSSAARNSVLKKSAILFVILSSYWCNPAFGCDVDGVLNELQNKVTGTLSTRQIADARGILEVYCQAEVEDAVTVAVAAAVVDTEESVRAELAEDEEPPPTLFGIEFRNADDDAPGHDRLRKRP